MGIATSGIIRAEGNTTASVLPTDRVVIQRYQSNNNGAYWVPYEATVGEIGLATLGGVTVQAIGSTTLAAGTATVALPAIAAGSLIFLTEANATPNALGYVITPGTGFVIHSASGADTSSVSYIVYS